MAIDTLSESVLSLTEAAKALPRRRKGKRPDVCTLYRWSMAGCRGVRLETIQIGGCRCTSREALQRFFERLTAQSAGAPIPEPPPRAQAASVRRAEAVLDKAGI
jgi:hypothetical protein